MYQSAQKFVSICTKGETVETEESIYVLTINRYDGEEDTSESVIACRNEKVLEAYQIDLEMKSAIIRGKLVIIEEKKDKLIKPLWKENHRLIGILMMPDMKTDAKKEERLKLQSEQKESMKKISEIRHHFMQKRCAIFKEFGMELHDCFIEDEDTTCFTIDTLEVLKG